MTAFLFSFAEFLMIIIVDSILVCKQRQGSSRLFERERVSEIVSVYDLFYRRDRRRIGNRICLIFCVAFTLLWARIAAKFANRASATILNRATGVF